MKKLDLTKFANDTKAILSKRSPEILIGIGIAGMVTTTVLAVKATPKALRLIEEAQAEQEDLMTHVEKTKACWKCYIPAVTTGVFSIACIIGANSVHARRNAGLAAAYKLSETALTEYRDKVVETFGEKKEKQVREKVDKERLEKNPVDKTDVAVTNSQYSTLCYDPISGRYFYSDIEHIKRSENKLNKSMVHDINGYVSVNDFYDELGLEHTSIGYDLGWNIDKGLLDIDFTSQIATDGTPCIVLNYNIAPKYGYVEF